MSKGTKPESSWMLVGAIVGAVIGLIPAAYGAISEPEDLGFFLIVSVILMAILGGLGALVGAAVGRVR